MPSILEIHGYKIYFWSKEAEEPIHVHISKGKPTPRSTKVWLTKSGGCILANNNGEIPSKDLSELLKLITSNYFLLVTKWKHYFDIEKVKFYC